MARGKSNKKPGASAGRRQKGRRAGARPFSRIAAWPASKKAAILLLASLALVAAAAFFIAAPEATGRLFRLIGVDIVTGPPKIESSASVGVHVIDVGQGTAVLLEDDGEYALIDSGPPEASYNLLQYLRLAGVTELRYLLLTHPHSDHYGNMAGVLRQCKVGTMVLPDLEKAPYPTASSFEELLQLLLDKAVPTVAAAAGERYPLGGGEIVVVHDGLSGADDYNLISLGLRYEGDGLSCLVTGDGEKENEQAMLAAGTGIAADVLVAGHHGSKTSNTAAFVQAVAPRFVAVSCAAGNSYGHPHHSALAAFDAAGAAVLRTDKQGSILFRPGDEGTLLWAVTKPA